MIEYKRPKKYTPRQQYAPDEVSVKAGDVVDPSAWNMRKDALTQVHVPCRVLEVKHEKDKYWTTFLVETSAGTRFMNQRFFRW